MPNLKDIIDFIWPKKATILVGRIKPYTSIFFINDELCFMQIKDGPLFPHLKFLHKYPDLIPSSQVDKGAIKYILDGANAMCPGFTSKGGIVPKVDKDSIVAIIAEGKENAMAIGITLMSGEEIKKINKGIAVELYTYLGDETWFSK